MCGRYEYDSRHREHLRKVLKLGSHALRKDSDRDIRPGTAISTVIQYGSFRASPSLMWGLLPRWAKEKGHKPRPINARAENITTNGYFAKPFRFCRCLIPASAYFEWSYDRGGKRKWRIAMADGSPIVFAGVHDTWKDDDDIVESCAIVTTAASGVLKDIHQRMPAIISPQDYDRWLDPTNDLRPLKNLVLEPRANMGLVAM